MSKRKRVVSAVQPTSTLTIGNLFGSIASWPRLAAEYEAFFAVAVYHAITLPWDADHLRANTEQMVIDLVACGVDPHACCFFLQSDVPEHFEMMWILGCLTPLGDLERMPQYREKAGRLERAASEAASAGLMAYPLLQAADILAYNAHFVPVGRDQLQHVELARDVARRFNAHHGELLAVPEALLSETPKIRSLASPTQKMSKSLGPRHYIGLFEDELTIRDKVRRAVTDAGIMPEDGEMSPGVANLLELLNACGEKEAATDFTAAYGRGRASHAELKSAVADALVRLTTELRLRRAEVERSRAAVFAAVRRNGEAARAEARTLLDEVRRRVGVLDLGEVRHE